MYNSITNAYPDVQFDIYGVTWDHCELPVNTYQFKNVNIVNWHDKDFRLLEQYKEVYYKAKSEVRNLPVETRDIAFLNILAQWWGMLQCFKDASMEDDYDLYVRARWDLKYEVKDITKRVQDKERLFTNLHTPKTIFGSAVSIEYGGKDVVKWHDQFFILSKDCIDALDFSNNTATMSLVNTFGLDRWPPIHLYKNLSATIFNHYDPDLNFTALGIFNKEWFRRTIADDIDTAKFFSMKDIDKAQQIKRPK
tara:strand:+ start:3360 stop:4112 length:753 start_codon:yes stop_codon:yes gene_type:complete